MVFADFAARLAFTPDDYQVEACRRLEAGSGVLVAAPTGAGKTVVGEFAVFLARHHGTKCFYTTPIKALSNQKHRDLAATYGADQVGLLTGDQVINPEADIVVMTTEVLRNMIYAGSATLRGLEYVVLDEVHYLADPFRGPVWEEVILALEARVKLVGLSATVSNVDEFGAWLASVRGDVAVVASQRRPVPLYQHVFAGRHLLDMFDTPGAAPVTEAPPAGPTPKVNPELLKLASQEARLTRDDSRRLRGRGGRGRPGTQNRLGGVGPRLAARSHLVPRRLAVVDELARRDLLPAIFFIFSRQGCDQAVAHLIDDGLSLTSEDERERLRAIAERWTAGLSPADLAALRYRDWLEAFTRGVAAHHAGALPAFKQAVEEAFSLGLVKVVCATETLALGINMPARTVVLDRLVKYNGVSHADITAGEYTQLTGRAGRRGLDVEGHAVVTWQAGLDPRALAGLASRRTYPLRSAFTPTYNMTVNLIGSLGVDRARAVLRDCFAQFHADFVRPPGVGAKGSSLVKKFEAICLVLLSLGHVSADDDGQVNGVTAPGRALARLYGSHDLLIAEAIRAGVFDGLELASLAATVSTLVYEARLVDKRAVPRLPDQPSARAVERLRHLGRDLQALERDVRLESAPPLDIGFAKPAWLWASGADLGEIVDATDLAVGDFVRWIRQTIDCAGQIADASAGTALATRCRQLVVSLRRGIVAVDDTEV